MTMIVPTKRKRTLTDKQRAAAITANARAAAIFGDAPLFDAPRVRPAAQAAVLDVIARTWNTLSHVAPMRATDIVISMSGAPRSPRHEWQHDAKGDCTLPAPSICQRFRRPARCRARKQTNTLDTSCMSMRPLAAH
jgi:hypothetical protein